MFIYNSRNWWTQIIEIGWQWGANLFSSWRIMFHIGGLSL
jgi:hypothetical protein